MYTNNTQAIRGSLLNLCWPWDQTTLSVGPLKFLEECVLGYVGHINVSVLACVLVRLAGVMPVLVHVGVKEVSPEAMSHWSLLSFLRAPVSPLHRNRLLHLSQRLWICLPCDIRTLFQDYFYFQHQLHFFCLKQESSPIGFFQKWMKIPFMVKHCSKKMQVCLHID